MSKRTPSKLEAANRRSYAQYVLSKLDLRENRPMPPMPKGLLTPGKILTPSDIDKIIQERVPIWKLFEAEELRRIYYDDGRI